LNDNGDVTPGTRSSDASESRPNDNPALDRPLTQLNKTAEVLKQHLDALTNTSSQRLKTETRAQLQKHQRALAKISLEISDYYMSQRNSWSKLQADRDEATRLLSTAPSRAVEYSTTTSQSLSNEIKRGEIEAEILALEVTNKVIFQDGEHTFRALLENSRCQGSTNATIRGAQREIKPAPADLVVLINPAASSIVAKKMITAFKEPRTREFLETKSDVGDQKPEREEREWTRPWIISITSEADNATGTILPIAKGLGSVFKHFRENTGEYSTDIYEDELKAKWIQRSRTSNSLQLSATPQPVSNLDLEDQRFYATHTPPHSEALSSHFLLTNGTPVYLTDKSDARQALAYNLRSELPPNVFETRKHRFKILPKPWAWNNTAYWVINAPSELIPGHNEFWNPDFYALVGGLYRLRRDFDDLPQPNRTNQTPDQVSAVGSLISK